jgi:hypothetical protein
MTTHGSYYLNEQLAVTESRILRSPVTEESRRVAGKSTALDLLKTERLRALVAREKPARGTPPPGRESRRAAGDGQHDRGDRIDR